MESVVQSPVQPTRVVIVGGGFAGIAAARALVGSRAQVTIIDQHNYHTFLPLLYQVATAGLEPADIAYPIRTIFRRAENFTFRHGRVVGINHERSVVLLASGGEIPFEQLVIASGATAAYFSVPGAEVHARPLYSLADARRLRNHLLLTLEAADARGVLDDTPLNFVVVGGGPTGVEIAGAISELLDISVRRDRLRLHPDLTRIILVDLAPRLLTAFPASAGAYAARILSEKGVEVRLNRSVTQVERDRLLLSDGEILPAAAVIWAAGVTVQGTVAATLGESSTGNGRRRVGRDLRVVGYDNVWAIGDAAAVLSGEDMQLAPQLAPVAIQSGRHCGRQITNLLAGRPTEDFRYRNKGIMATIGRNAAVAKLPNGPVIRGVVGWLAWLTLHLVYLVGFRNRLRVLINWTWRYFDWPSGPRLIVADAETTEQ
ncbi:MAG TPA: NAD(P)/FAD-dependent oxidoreductase [Acidimicrobiales bacterium]|nr:NAD(P)/FAD-dependent oxidoreductase [Acidimicrobiales bacterium]